MHLLFISPEPFDDALGVSGHGGPSSVAAAPPLVQQLQCETWFHGSLSRREAERLLTRDGDFLVRESGTTPGQYVLTGQQGGQAKHLLLVDPEGVVSQGAGENMAVSESLYSDFYSICLFFIINSIFSHRSALKTIGSKVWATSLVTTWTTDYPSCQLVVKYVCSSQWSAGPDVTHPLKYSTKYTHTLYSCCLTQDKHIYICSVKPSNTTLFMIKNTNAPTITKEAKKEKGKKKSHFLCKITLMLLLLHISVLSGTEMNWNCDLRSSTPTTFRRIHPLWRSTAAISQQPTVNQGGTLRSFQNRAEKMQKKKKKLKKTKPCDLLTHGTM